VTCCARTARSSVGRARAARVRVPAAMPSNVRLRSSSHEIERPQGPVPFASSLHTMTSRSGCGNESGESGIDEREDGAVDADPSARSGPPPVNPGLRRMERAAYPHRARRGLAVRPFASYVLSRQGDASNSDERRVRPLPARAPAWTRSSAARSDTDFPWRRGVRLSPAPKRSRASTSRYRVGSTMTNPSRGRVVATECSLVSCLLPAGVNR
jgi:hypothetical protein